MGRRFTQIHAEKYSIRENTKIQKVGAGLKPAPAVPDAIKGSAFFPFGGGRAILRLFKGRNFFQIQDPRLKGLFVSMGGIPRYF